MNNAVFLLTVTVVNYLPTGKKDWNTVATLLQRQGVTLSELNPLLILSKRF